MPPPDQKRIAALEMLLQSAQEPVYFHGETMLPLFREADEVIIEPVDWTTLRRGDIVTYRHEDKFPTRRIIFIDSANDTLTIKGDSLSLHQSYLVQRADVLGRAVARRREGQWLEASSLEWLWRRWWVLLRNSVFTVSQRVQHAVRWRLRRLFNAFQ